MVLSDTPAQAAPHLQREAKEAPPVCKMPSDTSSRNPNKAGMGRSLGAAIQRFLGRNKVETKEKARQGK